MASSVYVCPLCENPADDRTELRVHLQLHHRKNDVTVKLLDTLEEMDRRKLRVG